MKDKKDKSHLIFPSLFAQFFNIALFMLLYSVLPKGSFTVNNEVVEPKFIDVFNLSTTIQAGVGVTSLTPVTTLGKFIMALQQILMIAKNLTILYFFTTV